MNAAITFMPPAVLALFNTTYAITQTQDFVFWFLFAFRYVRLVVHIIAYLFVYKPTAVPAHPTYSAADCTVIVPTVDPLNEDFNDCLHSILMNSPAAVLIVTVGAANKRVCQSVTKGFQMTYPATEITVLTTEIASKRRQVCAAIPFIKTSITVLADDHVFWPSLGFLPTVVAPFEDAQVGCVGMVKKVRREPTGLSFRSFFNFLGCVYLERHNFELTATNAVDGGVFVVSGRTSVIRTSIIQDPEFMAGFTNEMFFFKKFGPLNADDDNFITRWLVTNEWKIKFQNCAAATVETTLGTYPKFLSQCLRWVRTTWRSNSASLFTDGTVWLSQPWCVYAVYITSFFNFALFYDAALIYTLYSHTSFGNTADALYIMAAWIFASKMVKLLPHFLRCPADLIFIPGYIAFAYYHSLLKLYAGFTFYVTAWGGRNLAAVGNESEPDDDEAPDAHFNTVSDIHSQNPRLHVIRDTSSYASSTSWDSPSPPSSYRGHIQTPWGLVRRHNPTYQPANVLEPQIPEAPRADKKKGRKSSSKSSSRTISCSSSGTVSAGFTTRNRKLSFDPTGKSSNPLYIESVPCSPVEEYPMVQILSIGSEIESVASTTSSTYGRDAANQLQQELEAHTRTLRSRAPSIDSSAEEFCTGSQYPQELSTQVSSWMDSTEFYTKPRPNPRTISRSWMRGVDCGRQHDGKCHLDYRGRCEIRDVREVSWYGR